MTAEEIIEDVLTRVGTPLELRFAHDVAVALHGEFPRPKLRELLGGSARITRALTIHAAPTHGWLTLKDLPEIDRIVGSHTPRIGMLRALIVLLDADADAGVVWRLSRSVQRPTRVGQTPDKSDLRRQAIAQIALHAMLDRHERAAAVRGVA